MIQRLSEEQMAGKLQKDISMLIDALDDQLYLLSMDLDFISADLAYQRDISTRLRLLVCSSSHNRITTAGLLWRLAEQLEVSDEITIPLMALWHKDKPSIDSLVLGICGGLPYPDQLAEFQDLPSQSMSFKKYIQEYCAFNISGKNITNQTLIKMIANQIGTAHEDDEIDKELAVTTNLIIGDLQSHLKAILPISHYVLCIGERVLLKAESLGYTKKIRVESYNGDITIVCNIRLLAPILENMPICTFSSWVNGIEISYISSPNALLCKVSKHGAIIKEMKLQYPMDIIYEQSVMCIFQYCSHRREFYISTDAQPDEEAMSCDIGYITPNSLQLHADEPEKRQLFLSGNACAFSGIISQSMIRRYMGITTYQKVKL